MSTREQGVRRVAAVTGGLVAASIVGTLAVAAAAQASSQASTSDQTSDPTSGQTSPQSPDDGGGWAPGSDDDGWNNAPQGNAPQGPGGGTWLWGGGSGPGHAATGGS